MGVLNFDQMKGLMAGLGSRFSDLTGAVDNVAEGVRSLHKGQRNIKEGVDALHKHREREPPPPKLSGRQRFIRHATLHALSSSVSTPDDVWVQRYMRRGAVDPASLTRPTWAAELAPADLMAFLSGGIEPRLFPRLAQLGLQVNIPAGGNGLIPYAAAGTVKGAWIGEAEAIPVVKLALTTAAITPKKLASISHFTLDLIASTTLDVETIVADILQRDLGRLIDTTLTDANPATAKRPAGLRSLGPVLPAAAAGPGAMQSDLSALIEAVGAAAAVFLCHPLQGLQFGFLPGSFAYPVLVSESVPIDTVIALDASAFVSAAGSPEFKSSEQATIHESDAPTAIGTAGAPAAVAAPTRDLWQSQCVAVRVITPVSWTVAGVNKVASVEDVTW